MNCGIYYKLARPDGWDFYTGKTINYRAAIGKEVHCPDANPSKGLCSSGLIHASDEPSKCFVGAEIPCSAYLVMGSPVAGDNDKHGFTRLYILEEIPPEHLDALFGWCYHEACAPVHPLLLPRRQVSDGDIALLRTWVSVWNSVWDSVRDSVWVYIGSLFPNITHWRHVDHEPGVYPFAAGAELWRRGLVPSYDGTVWRLHAGPQAEIVWQGTLASSPDAAPGV